MFRYLGLLHLLLYLVALSQVAIGSPQRGVPAQRVCYKVDGTPSKFTPCNDDKVSACCNAPDYCMSNGLCLDTGKINNLISVQGCTDPKWPKPCYRPCTGPVDGMGLGIISMIGCTGTNQMCCGYNSSCCSRELIQVPVATDLYRPGSVVVTCDSRQGHEHDDDEE